MPNGRAPWPRRPYPSHATAATATSNAMPAPCSNGSDSSPHSGHRPADSPTREIENHGGLVGHPHRPAHLAAQLRRLGDELDVRGLPVAAVELQPDVEMTTAL